MFIILKQNCTICDDIKTRYSQIPNIVIPDTCIGLGDIICRITCFFGINPCKSCMVRRYYFNKWFPINKEKKIIGEFIFLLKQKIIKSNIKKYPLIWDTKKNIFVEFSNEYILNNTSDCENFNRTQEELIELLNDIE